MNLHSADNIQHNIYLTSLLAVGNDVVIFLSPEKIITEFNSLTKKLFSWDAKQIIGRTFESIYQTKTITPFSLTEFTALLSGEIASIENLITVKNGQKINILWSIINLNEFDSTTSGFIIIGRNITDKKKSIIFFELSSIERNINDGADEYIQLLKIFNYLSTLNL